MSEKERTLESLVVLRDSLLQFLQNTHVHSELIQSAGLSKKGLVVAVTRSLSAEDVEELKLPTSWDGIPVEYKNYGVAVGYSDSDLR